MRILAPEDEPDLMELFVDEGSYEFSDSYPVDQGDVRTWFEAGREVQLTDPDGYLNLGAQTRDEEKVVGYISFYFAGDEEMKPKHRSGALTLMVNRKYWNRGFGTEMVKGIMSFGFLGIGLHDIRVGVDTRNLPARRMFERAGMKREGEFLEDRFVKGKWVSTAAYRLLATEYGAK